MDQPAGIFFSFSNCEYWCICFNLALSICRGRVASRVFKVAFSRPSSGPFKVSSSFQPKQAKSFLLAKMVWAVPSGFIITKKMIQYYVLFVQNRTPKKTWYLPPRRKRHSLKEDIQTGKRHLINSKNMRLPSAIKRLLTTRSIFRNLVAIFTNWQVSRLRQNLSLIDDV